jgi:phosphoglucomutase
MAVSSLAGKPAPPELLIDVEKLIRAYYTRKPDVGDPQQLVSFGTSGHRGSSLDGTFTEAHILAITQAVCEYRARKEQTGPVFIGKDTHALSAPAERTALEVMAGNGITTLTQPGGGFTPTPAVSHAILAYNRGRVDGLADGIIITPSHNPPGDGGLKYNPPHGGPADTGITAWIQDRANALLRSGNCEVKRMVYETALKAPTTRDFDFLTPYVNDLAQVIDMECIRSAGIRIGVDPLGGAATPYWEPIKEKYHLDINIVNSRIEPTFAFMPVDHDGRIRMDCSSPYAMANLVQLGGRYDVAFGQDPDADRHGIVTPSGGLMNPNHFLAVAVGYLLAHRVDWPTRAAVGKTLVSSGLIDRVVRAHGRKLAEVPVGFKWFVDGLYSGEYCFGGEESAGATFLRRDGTVWTTEKDGPIMGLLAAEITARTGKDPGNHFEDLASQFGRPYYTRLDAPATPAQKSILAHLSPQAVTAKELAGEPIVAKLTRAPGNGAAIGGLKVVTSNGWFAARPSGTESIYKIYAESFKDQRHLDAIVAEAQAIVGEAFTKGK